MISIDEKVNEINKRIEAIQVQIDFLENAIKSNSIWDEPDKPSRESVLDTYILRREALKALRDTLTQ